MTILGSVMRIGLDIGSTTIKGVVVDHEEELVFSHYERHFSQITQKTVHLLKRIDDEMPDQGSFG